MTNFPFPTFANAPDKPFFIRRHTSLRRTKNGLKIIALVCFPGDGFKPKVLSGCPDKVIADLNANAPKPDTMFLFDNGNFSLFTKS